MLGSEFVSVALVFGVSFVAFREAMSCWDADFQSVRKHSRLVGVSVGAGESSVDR